MFENYAVAGIMARLSGSKESMQACQPTSTNRLSRAMQKVQDGSLGASLVPTNTDGFADTFGHFNQMVKGLVEKERRRDAFGRYIAKELADDAMHHGVSLGGKAVSASVLFADIRDFTALTEKMPPEDVLNLINRYFAAVEPTVKEENGRINKFGGDSLPAVFGVLNPDSEHIYRAVHAALKMRASLNEFNDRQMKEEKLVLKIGIGIHCGKMVAASRDGQRRMKFTVIGDAVNMASRIEELNKKWDSDILASEVAKDTPWRPCPKPGRMGSPGRSWSLPSGRPDTWKRNSPSLMVDQEHA